MPRCKERERKGKGKGKEREGWGKERGRKGEGRGRKGEGKGKERFLLAPGNWGNGEGKMEEMGKKWKSKGKYRERRGGQTANSQPVAVAVAGANRQQPDTSLRGQTANSNN